MNEAFAPKRILVIKLRHIGDVLLASPIFTSLRAAFPFAELFACVNEGTEQMLATNPLLTDIFKVPVGGGRLLKQLRLISALRRKGFDLALDFTGSDRSAILTRLSGGIERLGYHRVKGFAGRNRLFTRTGRRKKNVHVVEQQADLLQQFGISSPSLRLIYRVREEDRLAVAQFLEKGRAFVHIHPVSRIMMKTWPAPFMARLLDHFSSRGLTPVVTASGHADELQFVRELKEHARRELLDLSGQLSLAQLAALSARASLFVGVDSAPLHLAAAVGTPVIGFFGPSSEVLWGPWCDQKLVLSRELDCRLPCQLKGACPHIACLREMTPEVVLPKVDQFMAALKL
jgi:heptosyltransferase-3